MPRGRADQSLRADAAQNRAAVLRAAQEAFAEEGPDVALEAIARRAGVSIATLYRRFPTRAELVAAAFEPKMQAYVAATRAAIAHADAWEGFAGFVRAVCAMQAADAGFADVLALTFPATAELDRRLRHATAGLDQLVQRAKAQGALRPDFVIEDLVLLLMANAGVVSATKRHAPLAWERFSAYMLDAFRAPGTGQLPPPINAIRLSRAIRRQVQQR